MISLSLLYNEYMLAGVLIVGVVAVLTAIVYMIGRAIGSQALSGWAKDEIYQIIGSIIIIALLISFVGLVKTILIASLSDAEFECTQSGCIYYETVHEKHLFTFKNFDTVAKTCTDDCHVEIARARIDSMYEFVRAYMASWMAKVGWLNILKSIEIQGFKPFAGTSVIIDTAKIAFDILFSILLLLKASSIFLTAIKSAVFPIFLISGILLRTFSPTRRLGGLLIGLAVTLFFFYPMVIIFTTLTIQPESIEPAGGAFTFEELSEGESSVAGAVKPFWSVLVDNWKVKGTNVDFITYSLFKSVSDGGILHATSIISIWVIFQQVIVIYSTVVFFKSTSPFFGGDVTLVGISKLI